MTPTAPSDFTNPVETKIITLQKQYLKDMAEGVQFETLKLIKQEIKLLKAELASARFHGKEG